MSRDKQLDPCHGETTKDEIQGFSSREMRTGIDVLPPKDCRKIMVSLLLLIEQWARSYGVWLGEQARSHTP